MDGEGDDLGGGVFNKRLNRNMHRNITLAKGDRYWIFEYEGWAKIEDDELEDFRTLAKSYSPLNAQQIARL